MKNPIPVSAPATPPVAVLLPARRSVLFLALTGLMYVLVLAGFWPYWRVAGASTPPRPWIIHFHAAVFTGWMVMLLAQVMLVRRRQVALHQRLGRIGIGYGVAVFMMGTVATIVAPAVHLSRQEWTLEQAAGFLIYPAGDMILFGTLFAAAVWYRRKSDIHKHFILLATVALMFAPAARLMGPYGVVALLAVWLSSVLIAMAADLRTARRIHVVYIAGTAWLLVGFTRVALEHNPTWIRLGGAFLETVTPTVARLF